MYRNVQLELAQGFLNSWQPFSAVMQTFTATPLWQQQQLVMASLALQAAGTRKMSSGITVFTIPQDLLVWATSLLCLCLQSSPELHKDILILPAITPFFSLWYTNASIKFSCPPHNLTQSPVQCKNNIMKHRIKNTADKLHKWIENC